MMVKQRPTAAQQRQALREAAEDLFGKKARAGGAGGSERPNVLTGRTTQQQLELMELMKAPDDTGVNPADGKVGSKKKK
ncbi:MAG: hypothetical protein ABH950_08435 [Candidatus Altiarchaeota archaeon]